MAPKGAVGFRVSQPGVRRNFDQSGPYKPEYEPDKVLGLKKHFSSRVKVSPGILELTKISICSKKGSASHATPLHVIKLLEEKYCEPIFRNENEKNCSLRHNSSAVGLMY